MGQQMARYNLDRGARLYSRNKRIEAVEKWKIALNQVRRASDKFSALAYLISASAQLSHPFEMLEYAKQQRNIAEMLDCAVKDAYANFNLAVARYYLGENRWCVRRVESLLERDVPKDTRLAVDCHLFAARSLLALGEYDACVRHLYEARIIKNKQEIELQIHIILGDLFIELKDYEKAEKHYEYARGLSESFDVTSCKYQRESAIRLAEVNCKFERLDDAISMAKDALRASAIEGDVQLEARCLACLGEANRRKGDFHEALENYEQAKRKLASNLPQDFQKRPQQLLHRLEIKILLGKTATLMAMRRNGCICECKALELNKIILSKAEQSDDKITKLRCNIYLEKLYRYLSDWPAAHLCSIAAQDILQDTNLQCSVCRELLSVEKPTSVDILLCCHLAHSRCCIHLPKLRLFDKRPYSAPLNPRCKRCNQEKQQTMANNRK